MRAAFQSQFVPELIQDRLDAYGVRNVVVLFSYLFGWKGRFVAAVGLASNGENERFQRRLRAGMWQELSGTFCCQFKCQMHFFAHQIRRTLPTSRRDV